VDVCVHGAGAKGDVAGSREDGAPEREEEGAWEHFVGLYSGALVAVSVGVQV